MSKKKGKQEEKKLLLGRVGKHLKMGIVGLPNVGKSSLFNLLSNVSVPAENYPFCTIDPTTAKVIVPDPRFQWLLEQYKPQKNFEAFLEIVDIAGLVKGASEGQGLGNAFLANIKATDGIYHVIRIFEDKEVTHVEGNVDPVRDLEIITSELLLKDIEFCNKYLESAEKLARTDKTKRGELEIVQKVHKWVVEDKKEVRAGVWNNKEIEVLNQMLLLTSKPVVFLVNMSERSFMRQSSKHLGKIKKWVDEKSPGSKIIPFSAAFEQKLMDMGDEERKKFLAENPKAKQMLPKIINCGYSTLHLIHFFTVGADEVKAWTIREGTKAPQAGAVIHTDFEKYFVKCDVMKYDDLHELGSENAVKGKGKYRMEGKGYEVKDGDILHFKVAK